MSMQFVRRRSRPRISVNKLGEYLAENKASRRLAILKDQKREIRCRVVQYQGACRAIVAALSTPGDAMCVLAQHLETLANWQRTPDDSDFDARENRLCQEAILAFMEFLPSLNISGLTLNRGHNDLPKLHKAGVAISVRPELVVRGTTRQGRPVVGAIKLHFPKTHPLSQDAGEYVGVILHEFGELHLSGVDFCDHRHCFVIDISTRQLFTAPKNYVRRRSDVEAACREIATLWDTLPVD